MKKKRIPTDGEPSPWASPFAVLQDLNLQKVPDAPTLIEIKDASPLIPKKPRGRVDIIREKAHRGGKTVTVVKGFAGVGQPEKEQLARKMQKVCGAGGTVKEGRIEIQGDHRETIAHILTEAGFRPVVAGG